MGHTRAVQQTIVLPLTPDELWAVLTDPAELESWFGATVDWDLTPGGLARFQDDDGTEHLGVVETVRPAEELGFRWWTPGEDASEVRYTLEEVPDGTRLTVVEQEVPAEPQASAQWGVRLAGLWLARAVPILA